MKIMARALLIGLSAYDNVPSLKGCVNDAREMESVLQCHEDGSSNYDCLVLTSPGPQAVTRKLLRKVCYELFASYGEDILFYFSGHCHPTETGCYLVTQDADVGDPGLSMNDLITLANQSKARSVLLILDCCFAGGLADTSGLQGNIGIENGALLRKGLTILAATSPAQTNLTRRLLRRGRPGRVRPFDRLHFAGHDEKNKQHGPYYQEDCPVRGRARVLAERIDQRLLKSHRGQRAQESCEGGG